MTIHNKEIADLFTNLADLLEIAGENPFRIRAYRNAALVISSLPKEAAELVKNKSDLTELPGIGKDLAEKIKTIIKTGTLPLLKQMEKRVPPVLIQLLKIEGLGPKRVQVLYKKLRIKNLNDLEKSIESGKLQKIKGFGNKTAEKIRNGISHVKEYSKRIKLSDATPIAESLLHYLKQSKYIKKVEVAGSYRRKKDTVGDLDILVEASDNQKAIDHFVHFNEIANVISKGETRSTVRLRSGIQVDMRAVPQESYGSALLYFTGSKSHNIAIRKIAQKKKLKINEYGVFKGSHQIAGKTEADVYRKIGLSYVEPELREDRGEIELAKQNKLPQLITLKDIRGDLHCHSNATDGNAEIEAMAIKAKALGYQYIAMTDHSKHLTVANGLNDKELLAQIKLIDKLNSKLNGIVILKSIEVDILEDGTLDMSLAVLKELDLTVCSIHSKFNLSQKKQTERIIRAMDNPYFTILAHPTGRLINRREPYQVSVEQVLQAASDRGCFVELNAQPDRMDLNDIYCKMAKEMHVKLAISTDAHSVSQMDNMRFGIAEARRGWLEADDVINTYSLAKLKKALNRK